MELSTEILQGVTEGLDVLIEPLWNYQSTLSKDPLATVIQGRDILIGTVARIENVLFHIRAWWQHEFLVTVIMVSQDSKGATCKPNDSAIRFLIC